MKNKTQFLLIIFFLIETLFINCYGQQYLEISYLRNVNLPDKVIEGIGISYFKSNSTRTEIGLSIKYLSNQVVPYQNDVVGQSIGITLNQVPVAGLFRYVFFDKTVTPYVGVEAGGAVNMFRYISSKQLIKTNISVLVNPMTGLRFRYKSIGAYLDISYYVQSLRKIDVGYKSFDFPYNNFLLRTGFLFKIK